MRKLEQRSVPSHSLPDSEALTEPLVALIPGEPQLPALRGDGRRAHSAVDLLSPAASRYCSAVQPCRRKCDVDSIIRASPHRWHTTRSPSSTTSNSPIGAKNGPCITGPVPPPRVRFGRPGRGPCPERPAGQLCVPSQRTEGRPPSLRPPVAKSGAECGNQVCRRPVRTCAPHDPRSQRDSTIRASPESPARARQVTCPPGHAAGVRARSVDDPRAGSVRSGRPGGLVCLGAVR